MYRLTRLASRFLSVQSKFTNEEILKIKNWADKFPLSHVGAAQLLTGYSLEGEMKDFSKYLQTNLIQILKEELGVIGLMQISMLTVWQSLLNRGKMDNVNSKLEKKYHKQFFNQVQFLALMTDNMEKKYGKEATNQK